MTTLWPIALLASIALATLLLPGLVQRLIRRRKEAVDDLQEPVPVREAPAAAGERLPALIAASALPLVLMLLFLLAAARQAGAGGWWWLPVMLSPPAVAALYARRK